MSAQTYLPKCDACVGIFNGGESSIGIDADEGLLLRLWKFYNAVFEWKIKLFENYTDLPIGEFWSASSADHRERGPQTMGWVRPSGPTV